MGHDVAKTHKYLKKRHKTYVLRVPVPKAIQEIMGYKEITRSLKTRDEREANYRYPDVLKEIQAEFAVAEAQLAGEMPASLEGFDPIVTARAWYEREHTKLINTDIQQFEVDERADLIEELRFELSPWSSGEFEAYGSNLQVMTDCVLIEAGYPTVPLTQMHTLRKGRARPTGSAYVDKSDMKYHQFAELIRRARVQFIETELQLLGHHSLTTFHSLRRNFTVAGSYRADRGYLP